MSVTKNRITSPYLRIAIVNRYFFPVTAGIETVLYELTARFVQAGHRVTVHASTDTLSEHDVLPATGTVNGVEIQRYRQSKLGFVPNIDFQHTDILVLTNFTLFPHLWVIAMVLLHKMLRQKTYRFIFAPNGGFTPNWNSFSIASRTFKQLIHKTIGTFALHYVVDEIQAVSEWEREMLIGLGIPDVKITVIPCGLEDETFAKKHIVSKAFAAKVGKVGRYILQVGRIDSIKNIETAIRALPYISEDIHFLIAGPIQDVEYQKRLVKLINKLRLVKRVTFLGEVSKEEKHFLLEQAVLYVQMAYAEGFSITVHEALYHGCVCIVSDDGALPYAVKDGVNGYCVQPEDFRGVAEKVAWILDPKQKAIKEKISKTNRQKVRDWNWDVIARKHLALFAKSIDQKL